MPVTSGLSEALRRAGCRYDAQVVPDHQRLFKALGEDVAWTHVMRSRRTASMGVPYNYSGLRYRFAQWHPLVETLREVIEEQYGFLPNNCLLNDYPTGEHSMGWHSDSTEQMSPGSGIAILSLGAARRLEFRRRGGAVASEAVLLEPGSLLEMSASMQADWQHALPRSDSGHRMSLTFRRLDFHGESGPR